MKILERRKFSQLKKGDLVLSPPPCTHASGLRIPGKVRVVDDSFLKCGESDYDYDVWVYVEIKDLDTKGP